MYGNLIGRPRTSVVARMIKLAQEMLDFGQLRKLKDSHDAA